MILFCLYSSNKLLHPFNYKIREINDTKKLSIELLADHGEILIDFFTNNEIIKEIPIFRDVIQLWTIKNSFSDFMYARKFKRFIEQFDFVSDKEKEELRKKIKSKPEEANKAGQTILLVINNISDFEKPEIIARIFIAFIDEYLDINQFKRIIDAIKIAYIDDLKKFFTINQLPIKSQEQYLRNLVSTGLTEITAGKSFNEGGELYYELTDLGEKAFKAYYRGSEFINQ